MKFVVEVQHVGTVSQLDDLVRNAGYDPAEVMATGDSQELDAIREHFGKPGEQASVDELSYLFIIARDGDYAAIYGCDRSTPWLDAPLYEIVWKLVEPREWNWLAEHFRYRPCPSCGKGAINHTRHEYPKPNRNGVRFYALCDGAQRVPQTKEE